MEADEEGIAIRRVRALLKLAAKKGGTGQESPKERKRMEAEFFKKLFMECDRSGTGTLNLGEVIKMARKRLKIAERLVSDEQLRQFFCAIDQDGGGDINFHEFLAFVRTKEKNPRLNDIVLTQVKRAVRLAIQRQRMTLQQLEARFLRCGDEGIMDPGGDGSLGPEEMRRFFRKILDVSAHEAPDRNLMIAFKAMDEDGGGSLDADEFMDFIRDAITEETALCPPSPRRALDEPHSSVLLCGMRGVLPKRLPTVRPGTTYESGAASMPFCTYGRELESRTRHAASSLTVVRTPSVKVHRNEQVLSATLSPSGLPKGATIPRRAQSSQSTFGRSCSANFFMTAASAASTGRSPDAFDPMATLGSTGFGKTTKSLAMSLPSLGQTMKDPADEQGGKTAAEPAERSRAVPEVVARGHYTPVKGMLSAKDANALNRIEQRLFDAGVDVRGHYHNTVNSSPALGR